MNCVYNCILRLTESKMKSFFIGKLHTPRIHARLFFGCTTQTLTNTHTLPLTQLCENTQRQLLTILSAQIFGKLANIFVSICDQFITFRSLHHGIYSGFMSVKFSHFCLFIGCSVLVRCSC